MSMRLQGDGVAAMPVCAPKLTPIDALQCELEAICGAFALRTRRRDGMVAGHVANRVAGIFDTAIVAYGGGEIERSAGSIRRDPGEHLFLVIQDAGNSHIVQGERSAQMRPGDMFLVDSVCPSHFRYPAAPSVQISLHMPRAEMIHRFGAACSGGVAFRRDDPLCAAMRAMVEKMMMIGDGPQPRIGQAFLAVLDAYFHDHQGGAGRTVLSRALALADAHYTDPAFGPGDLAARLNISTRMLQRHFQIMGQTPGERILDNRLALAYGRLANGASPNIAMVAYESGFNDLSYFYRVFRGRYGVTPGAVLRRGVCDEPAVSSNPADAICQDVAVI